MGDIQYCETCERVETCERAKKDNIDGCEIWQSSKGTLLMPIGTFEAIYNDTESECDF